MLLLMVALLTDKVAPMSSADMGLSVNISKPYICPMDLGNPRNWLRRPPAKTISWQDLVSGDVVIFGSSKKAIINLTTRPAVAHARQDKNDYF